MLLAMFLLILSNLKRFVFCFLILKNSFKFFLLLEYMLEYRDNVLNGIGIWYASKFERFYTPDVERKVVIITVAMLDASNNIEDILLAAEIRNGSFIDILRKEQMKRTAEMFFGYVDCVAKKLEEGVKWSNPALDKEYLEPCKQKARKITGFIDEVERRRGDLVTLDQLFLEFYDGHIGFTQAYLGYFEISGYLESVAILRGNTEYKEAEGPDTTTRILRVAIPFVHEEVLPISLQHTSSQL